MYKPEYMQRVRIIREIENKCQCCGKEKERKWLKNCDKCINKGTLRKRKNRNIKGEEHNE